MPVAHSGCSMTKYLENAWSEIEQVVARALAEDVGAGDVTTEALVPADLEASASILAKRDGVLAGMDVVKEVFRQVDPSLRVKALVKDGARVKKGQVVGKVRGRVASILKGERVALNFLQRMSGIAAETARYVEAVAGTKAVITDTRKTAPGLRVLDKYAVQVGGGRNHRMNLADGVLIKDNHLVALRSRSMTLEDAVRKARERVPRGLKVEVEVGSIEELEEALSAGADSIMLDNMKLEEMRRAVRLVRGRALVEASGGITLDNVRSVAETGVDLISVGALTHSTTALDISLELEL